MAASSSSTVLPQVPDAEMDAKLVSLLTHLDMQYWIPVLESELDIYVNRLETFHAIGEDVLRALIADIYEKHAMTELHLPTGKLDQLMAALYHDSKVDHAAPANTVPLTAVETLPTRNEPPDISAAEEPSDVPVCDRYTWDQNAHEVFVRLSGLPMSIKGKDVTIQPAARSLSLSVGGEVVLKNAELHSYIISEDVDFDLKDATGCLSRKLTVTLPKADAGTCTEPWPMLLKTGASQLGHFVFDPDSHNRRTA